MAEKKKKNNRATETDEGQGKGFRAYFVHLFGKYGFRNEQQFLFFGKCLVFALLILVELLLLWQNIVLFDKRGGWPWFISLLIAEVLLTTLEALNLFVIKDEGKRIVFYVLNACVACSFLFFSTGTYPILVYMLVLTQFYMSTERIKQSTFFWVIAIPVYIVGYCLQSYIQLNESMYLWEVIQKTFSSLFALGFHFLGVRIALTFYRQYVRLSDTLDELEESKAELEKAYAVVAEVTALEERQRIAKDIHDTAGHSLTTVIMQTESAKRLIEQEPEEAKKKIVAANLQAKHALEELRDSVHLLSGYSQNLTLKSALEDILHDSTDGTGIKIRSDVDDIEKISPAKYRFLCNTLKEGISNGLRHGGATAFWFELKLEEEKIKFFLSDNGKGLPIEELQTGFGLTTMRDRAKSLGGEISFHSEPEEGFEILLIMPADTEE